MIRSGRIYPLRYPKIFGATTRRLKNRINVIYPSKGKLVIYIILGFIFINSGSMAFSKQKSPATKMSIMAGGTDHLVLTSSIIRIYRKSLNKSPKDLNLRKRFTHFLMEQSHDEMAIEQLKILAKMDPSDEEIKQNLESLQKKLGTYKGVSPSKEGP